MKKNIFNYEGEEKEISLSNVKEIKSKNSSSNNSQLNKKNKKVKFENEKIPKFSLVNIQKTFIQESNQQQNEDIKPEKFERRKKKFNTLFVKESEMDDHNLNIKKKKRKKGKLKTMKITDNISKKQDKEKKTKKSEIESNINEENDEDIMEEFEDKEIQTKLEVVLEKKFTPTQTMLSYCKCQLFICYDNRSNFEYTGLEGILCVVINRVLSNLYIQIYDIMDFKKQFEIELYTNI